MTETLGPENDREAHSEKGGTGGAGNPAATLEDWLDEEMIRIASLDDLLEATEIDRLVEAAKNRDLRLDRRTLKRRLKALRDAGDEARQGHGSEEALEALVDRLNAEYFVYTGGDAVSICSWTMREKRRELVQRSVADFRLLLATEPKVFSPLSGRRVPAATAWLEHPRRREVKEFVFEAEPSKAARLAERNQENLFEGFAVAAKRGDIERFRQHLYDVLAAEEPELQRTEIVEYMLDCLAHLVQRPGTPLKVALVLRGKQGAGKSFVTDVITSLFKGNTFETSQAEDIVGRFTGHLLNACLVVGDEALFAGSRKDADAMKSIITQDTLRIEAKHRDVINVKNRMTLLLNSNHLHAVHVEPNDRRFFVLDVADCKTPRRDHEAYWKALWAWANSEAGKAALLDHLLSRDLSQFDAQRDRPHTRAHLDQILAGLNGVKSWFYREFVHARGLPCGLSGDNIPLAALSGETLEDLALGVNIFRKEDFHREYETWASEQRGHERAVDPSNFWKTMISILGADAISKRRVDGRPTPVVFLPPRKLRIQKFLETIGCGELGADALDDDAWEPGEERTLAEEFAKIEKAFRVRREQKKTKGARHQTGNQ